ncbi:hypothetical protein C8Q70DRAFT_245152 [Cubamyces menziesii]|nr:hypothetical protein C8Q70DRAFT_245152 [Cubamyces menziesii]
MPSLTTPNTNADNDANPPRAPSRAGYRRPPLARTVSSRNLFPDLPPISTKLASPQTDDSDSSDEDERSKHPSVALPPLCPPSPISPISSASSSSSLDSPPSSTEDLVDYQDTPGCDGFPPPPLPQSNYVPPPPAQPPSPIEDLDDDPPTLFHHGLSRAAFAASREFWDQRYYLWLTWQEHVDHLDAIQANYARDGLRATLCYPPSPALPRTRDTPGQGANGINPDLRDAPPHPPSPPPHWHRRSRLQTYNPYAPIFPRMGDLAALRDPYCDWPDRAFINFPTYCVHKILYLHDMLFRERELKQKRAGLSPLSQECVPDSPASMYSTDSSGTDSDGNTASPATCGDAIQDQDVSRPWELTWRARWQVLIDRQPYPPQPHPTPPHTPGYPPPPSLASSIHAPSPLSPGFSPSPPSAWNAAEDKTIHVWQESNDIPELVPLETPLTAVELGGNPSTFRATTQQTLGAGIVRASTPAPGWAESGPASPLVKLPASTLRRSTPTLPCPPAYTPSPAPLSAPSPTSATSLVGSTTESSGWEDVDLDSDEQEERLRDDLGALPPRPASPSPMFFFYDDEEELEAGSVASSFAVGHGGLEAGMVSVSVQPVSC